MAAGDKTPARRLPTPIENEPDVFTTPREPGDYVGPVHNPQDGTTSVYFLLPIARDPDVPPQARSVHRVASPPHRFRECADGSLEIRESIASGSPVYWHGYLDEGNVWREV